MTAIRPLGYYGLGIDAETENAIDQMPLHELTDFANDISACLNFEHYLDIAEIQGIEASKKEITHFFYHLADIQKIELIRALCDRIELKLMEAAK